MKSLPNAAYDNWKQKHDCKINHTGSAGKMEPVGVIKMFKRSVKELNLKYLTYIGDGDPKSYSEVCKANPYSGEEIVKAECIGHIQKRVGSRLRNLRDSWKGKKLPDGKRIGGTGRLTDKVMNSLQNYFGLAIRQNVGDLYGMKKAVAAIPHHCAQTDDLDLQHRYCPRGKESWCKYHSNRDKYKQKLSIPPAIHDLIKPIFSHKDLGNDDLLKKCLHGQTQNVNESLNGVIWTRVPKRVYVERTVLETGVASAVIYFNKGMQGLIPVFKELGMEIPGHYTLKGLQHSDVSRASEKKTKKTESNKKRIC